MSESFAARVEAVTPLTFGSEVAVAALVGATVLTVDDVGAFLPENTPGKVLINGTVYDYLTCDDDADTVTLASPGLTAAVAVGDRVDLYSAALGEVALAYELDGSDDDGDDAGDPPQATIDHALVPLLRTGVRGEGSEAVLLRPDGDDLRVGQVLGKRAEIETQYLGAVVARGYLYAALSVVTDTWTTVPWTIFYNSDVDYDSATNKFRLTIPGTYLVVVTAKWDTNGTGSRAVQAVYDTGVGPVTQPEVRLAAVPTGEGKTSVPLSDVKDHVAFGDLLHIEVQQRSTANLNLLPTDTQVTVYRMGA